MSIKLLSIILIAGSSTLLLSYAILWRVLRKVTNQPFIEKYWTTLFYGERGGGKSLEMAKLLIKILSYFKWLYKKYPKIKHAIIYSNQFYCEKLVKDNEEFLYHWDYLREVKYCPRKKCWRGIKRHGLHGAYLIIDDIGNLLPPDKWQYLPMWFRSYLIQGRKFGIKTISTAVDAFAIDLNYRRYVQMAWRFSKIISSRDPDETKPPVKRIWGWYRMRKIKAKWLWEFGDMTEEEIKTLKIKQSIVRQTRGGASYRGIWEGRLRWISRKVCDLYDTTQAIKTYKPTTYEHIEIKCRDPEHPDCGFKRVLHTIA